MRRVLTVAAIFLMVNYVGGTLALQTSPQGLQKYLSSSEWPVLAGNTPLFEGLIVDGDKLSLDDRRLVAYESGMVNAFSRKEVAGFAVFSAISSAENTPSGADKLPDGKGKQETARVCSGCHAIDTVITQRHSKAEWQKLVDDMAARGADGTDADLKAIVDYLAAHFGPKTAGSN